MSAVWMRARNELRLHWRALLSLGLIAGLGAGAAVAAVGGARRTLTVYPRFRAATHAFDDLIGTNGDSTDAAALATQFAELTKAESLPEVTGYSITDAFACTVTGPSGTTEAFPDLFVIASPDGRLGTTLNSIQILQGRRADPNKLDEVVLTTFEAQRLGAKVNSTLTLAFPKSTLSVRVVGIGIMAGAVDPSAGGYTPLALMTPAFFRAHTDPSEHQGPTLAVTIRGGLAGIPKLQAEIDQLNAQINRSDQGRLKGDLNSTISSIPQSASVRRTAVFQTVGLLLFGGLALLTVLAIFIQLLARQIFLESDEQDALRALGMSQNQLFGLALLRVAAVAIGASALAVVIAVVASPIFPIGFMHQLELSPGFRFDGLVLFGGAGVTVVLVVLAGLYPAWGASNVGARQREAENRTTKTANALAGASFPPSAVAGVRMALEPGHGRNAIPVRTTIAGTVLALTALVASLTFGASLQFLVATPSLSGWNFDLIAPGDAGAIKQIADTGVVDSYARGSIGQGGVDGRVMDIFAFGSGPFGASIVSGRRPEGTNEIALAAKTLHLLHTAVGKTVAVRLNSGDNLAPSGPTYSLRVVGVAITPQFFFSTLVGNSAVVSEEFLDAAHPSGYMVGGDSLYIRFKRGISINDGITRIRRVLPNQSNTFLLRRSASSDLTNIQRISRLPDALAGLLALVAAGTLAHTLITSVRRRRRDLAILRTLGFVRGQVRLAVVWQATTIILISLAIGLPLGAVAGRWAWHTFVGQLGYVPVSIVPMGALLLTIPAAILLANIIASIPARAAARTQPAVALRAE